MPALQIFQPIPVRVPPLDSTSAWRTLYFALLAVFFLVPFCLAALLWNQVAKGNLLSDGSRFDYTALWTGVGSVGVSFGVAIALITILTSRDSARSEALERVLKEGTAEDVLSAFRLIVPRNVPLANSKRLADAIATNAPSKMRDHYEKAVQLVENYYIRLQTLYETNAVPRRRLLDFEAFACLRFYYVVQDFVRNNEKEDGHAPEWRDWVRVCHTNYLRQPDNETLPVLREWKLR